MTRFVSFALAASASAIVCCGGSSASLNAPSGVEPDASATFSSNDAAAPSSKATPPTGATPGAPPMRMCTGDGTACTSGFGCCSGTCTSGACVGNVLGTAGASAPAGSAGGTCSAPGATCAMGPDCCSGLCEPVTGQAGVVQCLDACRADGVACTTAQDCCSLGCFGGVCTSKLCAIVGDSCAADADCCSGVCDPSTRQCNVDLANSRCRPTGEDCGKGPQSGCCGATKDDDLCDSEGRCGLPPGACRGQKATCTSNGDCCSNQCDPTTGTCVVTCAAAGATCVTGADCCTSSCTNGRCDAPPPAPQPGSGAPEAGPPTAPGAGCSAIGASCTDGSTCCSALCLAGFCDQPVILK
jgi:hypothetical protein